MLINNENTPAKERVLMSAAFDFETRFAKGLPVSQPKWTGFPKYNFIGGHNDPESIPVEGLIEATAAYCAGGDRPSLLTTRIADRSAILKCANFSPKDLQSIAG